MLPVYGITAIAETVGCIKTSKMIDNENYCITVEYFEEENIITKDIQYKKNLQIQKIEDNEKIIHEQLNHHADAYNAYLKNTNLTKEEEKSALKDYIKTLRSIS